MAGLVPAIYAFAARKAWMPGLDPGIHDEMRHALKVSMDRRVKPGDDDLGA